MARPFPRWLCFWKSWGSNRAASRRTPVRHSFRPSLESLESRSSPTAIGASALSDRAPPP